MSVRGISISKDHLEVEYSDTCKRKIKNSETQLLNVKTNGEDTMASITINSAKVIQACNKVEKAIQRRIKKGEKILEQDKEKQAEDVKKDGMSTRELRYPNLFHHALNKISQIKSLSEFSEKHGLFMVEITDDDFLLIGEYLTLPKSSDQINKDLCSDCDERLHFDGTSDSNSVDLYYSCRECESRFRRTGFADSKLIKIG